MYPNMKTSRFFGWLVAGLLLSTLSISTLSCQRADEVSPEHAVTAMAQNAADTATSIETTGTTEEVPADLHFCSEVIKPLCNEGQNLGSLSVKRGSDEKIYFTYSG